MRSLDRLLLGADRKGADRSDPTQDPSVDTVPAPESEAAPFIDASGMDEVLFDDVVVDEAEFGESVEAGPLEGESLVSGISTGDDIPYGTPREFDPGASDFGPARGAENEGSASRESASFTDALLAQLMDELRSPLSAAIADAERVLIEPDRVALWFENQARRRLLSLVEKFSDELRATEVKRVLTSPPSRQ